MNGDNLVGLILYKMMKYLQAGGKRNRGRKREHIILNISYSLSKILSLFQGPKVTSIQREPSSFLLETTEDMDISKTMLTSIHSMPHTAPIIMVRHSVRDMTFMLQATQAVTIILTSIVTRTPVRIVTPMGGQETIIFVQMR